MEVKQAVHCQNILGEGPIWVPVEGALYWVDIDGKKIQRFFPKNRKYESFSVTKKVSVLAPYKNGGFIVGAEDGLYSWDTGTNQLDFIFHPEAGKSNARFNDGKVDRGGRFWVGTMTPEGATSALYRLEFNRLEGDLSIKKMIEDVTISNGIGWSPNNEIMYYVDSLRYRVFKFDFDLKSGEISKRRVFYKSNAKLGVPDGLTVDSEGYIWLAIYDGWKIIRINPSGKVDAEINMPVSRPSSCAFGGKNLDMLYITSISEGLNEEQQEEQPLAGDLFVVQTDSRGIAEPMFSR
jgi:sugar lactone lactonase YvrE